MCARANRQAAAAGPVGGSDFLRAVDDAGGRKIRSRHVLHEARERYRRIVEQCEAGVDDLGQIMRRNVGRHADRDARGAIDEQVGYARGQYLRLVLGLVVVRDEVDRLLVDIGQQLSCQLRHAHLGVAHRRGRVAIDRAEIALSVDQQIAHRKRLRHAHDRVVDRDVAVRVIFADHIADHPGGFLVGPVVVVAEFAHRVQHAPVHRLEAVANVRQCAPDDDAHRIVKIGLPHLLFEADGHYFARYFAHSLGIYRI